MSDSITPAPTPFFLTYRSMEDSGWTTFFGEDAHGLARLADDIPAMGYESALIVRDSDSVVVWRRSGEYMPTDAPITTPCDHCDGEGSEVVCGEGGYRDGTCSRCNGIGTLPARVCPEPAPDSPIPVGCELPADSFFRLAGNHVCEDGAESFRVGYCADCADVIESEGLCGHGSYQDSCGYADAVIVVEWQTVGDSEWIPEEEPIEDESGAGLYELRKMRDRVGAILADIFADCIGESGGHYSIDADSILPDGSTGSVVVLEPMPHADGQTFVRARVRRGSL